MGEQNRIGYVEYPATNLAATKAFFTSAFGWKFFDYGSEYTSFSSQWLNGGFYNSELKATTDKGSALLVIYSDNLEDSLNMVARNGGEIVKPVFSFPGGRRFHFTDPSGNEFAVWTETTF